MTGYEFDEIQNKSIRGVAGYAKAWGAIAIGAGVLCMGLSVLGVALLATLAHHPDPHVAKTAPVIAIAAAPMGITNIVCGCLYLGAAGNLSAVVRTQGNDVPLLVRAIARLRSVFMVEAIVSVVAFVGGFVGSLLMNA